MFDQSPVVAPGVEVQASPAAHELLGDGVLGEHPLVDLELPEEDVAVHLVRRLPVVGEEVRDEQAGVAHVALEGRLVRRRGEGRPTGPSR